MVVVADLVAKVRAEGVAEVGAAARQSRQDVAALGQEVRATAQQLDQLAQKFASSQGGTPAGWRAILEKDASLTAAKAAEHLGTAATNAGKLATAVQQVTAPTQAVAKATADVHEGMKLSESSAVRFAAGLVGIGLGFSLVAGAARLVHDAVSAVVGAQLDWERSLKVLSGLYGEVGGRAAAVAFSQANLPGVLGSQQEFATAAINASVLTRRYGLPQQTVDQLTTTGGRLAFASGMTDAAEREALQAQILDAVQTGAPLPARYGIYTDAEAVARGLGASGAQSLQAFTPAELMTARAAIVSGGGNAFADRAAANQRAALDTVTRAAQFATQTQTALQGNLEGRGAVDDRKLLGMLQSEAPRNALEAQQQEEQRAAVYARSPQLAPASANLQGLTAIDAEQRVLHASAVYATALADSAKAQEDARKTLERLSTSVDASGAKLLSFFGSLEVTTSISHGDILAQAQGAVAARARSAVPLMGMSAAEIGALGSGDAWQAAWQNFVAYQAQGPQANAIQRNLEQRTDVSRYSGLAPDRRDARDAAATAAQRAIDVGTSTEPVYRGIRDAQTRGAQADLATAETQAQLEQITLTQRERSLQMLRETVDLRKLEVQQQQASLVATQAVIRAQQAALPIQRVVSAAQFQSDMAVALSQQRMARLLQGQDVSGLPSVDELIRMNVGGQLAGAEAAPEAVARARDIALAQQPATAADLSAALTATQIRTEELKVDLANLGELPAQTILEQQLVDNNRDQLSVQKELREYMKALVYIMTPTGTAPTAPSDLPGARHGPY